MQVDNLNADDHRFLESACGHFGVGISDIVYMRRFGAPGESLLGSNSHTPAAEALDMLAIDVGGLDVSLAMAGEPFSTTTPAILGARLASAVGQKSLRTTQRNFPGGSGTPRPSYGPAFPAGTLSAASRT